MSRSNGPVERDQRRCSLRPRSEAFRDEYSMNGDIVDLAERGLRCYVHRIATGLGLGAESVCCELADQAVAYLALPDRSPDQPDRDVALIWDEMRGWAVGVETGSGEDVLVTAWHGGDVLPAPDDVVGFAKSFVAGHPTGQSEPPGFGPDGDVRQRLAGYLTHD